MANGNKVCSIKKCFSVKTMKINMIKLQVGSYEGSKDGVRWINNITDLLYSYME